VVGPPFEPYCLHHPVLGFGPSQAISHFERGNRGFLAFGASLNSSPLAAGPAFAGLSPLGNFPFPAQAETGLMIGLRVTSSSPIVSHHPFWRPAKKVHSWRRAGTRTSEAFRSRIVIVSVVRDLGTGLNLFRTEAE
jgi:hypothetical protein